MAKKGHVRKGHPKFFKGLTIGGSIFGMLSCLGFIAILILDIIGVHYYSTDELREYTATFINEGAVYSERIYRRGELLEQPEVPSKPVDVGDTNGNYIFIGWDMTGEGIPDILPVSMYFSFTAKACYLGFGDFNLSLEDLMNMDLETILNLMEKLGIDWEQFMNMFNISPEDLMALLEKNAIFTFDADIGAYASYFRSTSYGDFDFGKKKFINPSSYDPSLISPNSVNPLRYTADKLYTVSKAGKIDQLQFVNYNITYNSDSKPYAVPDCEVDMYGVNPGVSNSDAYVLTEPENRNYQTSAVYCPALEKVISALNFIGFSTSAITADEIKYQKYAKDNYTKVPEEYYEVVDQIIQEHDWYPEDYYYVDEIGAYVESVAESNIIPSETTGYKYSDVKNKDPINDMLKNKVGSDFDFNTLAVMIFRRLNIPARMVYGYLVPQVKNNAKNIVTLLNRHYWCEIYVTGIGWMICDCMNAESILGMNPYQSILDKKANSISDPLSEEEVYQESEYIASDLSGEVSSSGPGDKLDNQHDIFSFETDYDGTAYFRSKSFDDYSNGQWSNSDLATMAADYYQSSFIFKNDASPLEAPYDIGDYFYKPQSFTITYIEKMKYGLAPLYPKDLTCSYYQEPSDIYVSKDIPEDAVIRYSSLYFPTTAEMIEKVLEEKMSVMYSDMLFAYNMFVRNYSHYLSYDSAYDYDIARFLADYVPDYGSLSTYELIEKVCDAFKNNYAYNINFDAYPSNIDPINAFFQRKEGICNNFASAAVMTYRYLGIPARFVAGYGSQSVAGKTNVVTNLEAHAWVEVYVDNLGWLIVDPTGYDNGEITGPGYGGGFGGEGLDNFEKIVHHHDLYVAYYGTDEDGMLTKTYDGMNLGSIAYIKNADEVEASHHVEIDQSPLFTIGSQYPGYYLTPTKVSVKVYDSNNKDVTEEFYTIHDDGLTLCIEGRELGDIKINLMYAPITPTYTGTPIDLTALGYTFNVNTFNPLMFGHRIEFVPDLVESSGEVEVTGTIIIYDSLNNVVTSCYVYDDISFPVVYIG